MENLKLNETPVRTAKNFRINNIKLENIEIPEVIPEFENVTITGDTSKIDIEQNADNIDINLAYGLSEELAVQVKAQANQKIKLNIKDTQNEKSKTENLEKAEAKIDFKFDDENSVLIDDIEITATENTKSTVVIKYTSNQESENYHNGIIKAKAEKEITRINKLRANHYKYYTEKEWRDPANYDICINSDAIGVERAAELICDIVNKNFLVGAKDK